MSAGFDDAMGESAEQRLRNYRKPARAKRTPWKDIAEAWRALAEARGVQLASMSPAARFTDQEHAAVDRLRSLGIKL